MIDVFAQSEEEAYPPIEFYTPYLQNLPDNIVNSLKGLPSKSYMDSLFKYLEPKTKRDFKEAIAEFMNSRMKWNDVKTFTPELLLSLNRISDPKVSPNSFWLMYSQSTPSLKDNKLQKDIYIESMDKRINIQMTTDEADEYNAVWSPDGEKIAFISTKLDKPQICITEAPDTNNLLSTNTRGVYKPLPNIPVTIPYMTENGADNLSWSPDGKYLAFTSDVKLDSTLKEKYPSLPDANAMVYTNLPIRHWDEWEDAYYKHLFIYPLPQKGQTAYSSPIDLMTGEKYDTPVKPFGGNEQIAWAPDGKEIAYTCKKVKNYEETTNSDIYIVSVPDGKTTDITKDMKGADFDPLYSPDGNWLAFHSQEHEGFESDRIRLMLYNRKTGEITELSKKLDQWVGGMVWATDSKSIYFSAENGATVQIYQMQIEDGSWKILTSGYYNYDQGIDITKDGKKLIVGRRNMLKPTDFFTIEFKDGNPLVGELTDVNSFYYTRLKQPKITERWIECTDGKKEQCWVIYPPDFDSTKKYPMLTYCQGGPQETVSQFFSYRWNFFLMASEGYVVVAPNRRGLPGFGQEWNNAISRDWGGQPMKDILSATDEMMKEPYIDKKGVAAVGASAGGYAVYWLEGNHNGRFSAFVAHSGVFDLVSMYGSTEELWFPNWEFGGPYWKSKNKEFYDKNSPHMFADNWDTPIMISCGEKDFRVPYTQALEAFTVAQVKGIPSKLVIFPEENHWVLSIQNSMLWFNEFFGFLDKYCKHPKK